MNLGWFEPVDDRDHASYRICRPTRLSRSVVCGRGVDLASTTSADDLVDLVDVGSFELGEHGNAGTFGDAGKDVDGGSRAGSSPRSRSLRR